jgi:hypothetical protein
MIIVDSHQDIAWNILTFGRDYASSAAETRQSERDTGIPAQNGDTLLGWPDYQKGRVAIIFATLFAAPIRAATGNGNTSNEWYSQIYADADQAFSLYSTQLDTYYRLVDQHPDKFRLVTKQRDLKDILSHWDQDDLEPHPVGLVPLMECADARMTSNRTRSAWFL